MAHMCKVYGSSCWSKATHLILLQLDTIANVATSEVLQLGHKLVQVMQHGNDMPQHLHDLLGMFAEFLQGSVRIREGAGWLPGSGQKQAPRAPPCWCSSGGAQYGDVHIPLPRGCRHSLNRQGGQCCL